MIGTFIIQEKRFYVYNQYFESGLNYLKSEDKDLIPFHESLSKERDLFIELHNYNKELEKEYELVYKEKTDLLTYFSSWYKNSSCEYDRLYNTIKRRKKSFWRTKNKVCWCYIWEHKIFKSFKWRFFSYLKFNLNEIPLNLTDVDIKIFFSQWEEEKSLSIKDHLLILEFLNLENSKIKTEPQLLLRIMENLITNAVNYSVKGTSINIKVEEINGMLK